ncbi:Na+/H+ antiporter [Halobacteriaceae archaeon GCM10025711]
MAVAGIEAELLNLLTVFIIGAAVGIFVAKVGRFPYTIALLLAGFAVSIVGVPLGIELSHDFILLVLLPPLLFEGAATTNLEHFRVNTLPILALAIPGLVVSVVLLGFAGEYAFGFPLVIALLFASMILPTDPVSVLALFEELGAPDRLSVIVEGESLINDGVGVVLYSALLALVLESQQQGLAFEDLVTPARLGDVAVGIAISSVGGLLVGLAAGYAVYRVMVNLDEHMTEIVLTLILAYGSFLLAEHYLHVSGVIATVVAGLFIGNRGAEYAMSPQTKISIFNTWETAAFLVNTLIFLLIGAATPVGQLVEHADLIAIAVVLVLAARAAIVYPIMGAVNRALPQPVSLDYQHVLVWGGLHASIPIALVLGLPASIPFREELRAMVFGVAAFSLVVQGLSMRRLLDALGVVTRSESEELYELLVGRARAADAALSAAESLHDRGELPDSVYEDFAQEYGREKEDLNAAIAQLLREHPDIRREELLVGERRVLTEEKSAIMDAMRTGLISDDVGGRLLNEADLKLDYVYSGETTVKSRGEGYEEFWRDRAAEFGLDVPSVSANGRGPDEESEE